MFFFVLLFSLIGFDRLIECLDYLNYLIEPVIHASEGTGSEGGEIAIIKVLP